MEWLYGWFVARCGRAGGPERAGWGAAGGLHGGRFARPVRTIADIHPFFARTRTSARTRIRPTGYIGRWPVGIPMSLHRPRRGEMAFGPAKALA